MDLKQIKELMAAMEKAGIKKLSLKEKTGYELHLERQDENPAPAHSAFTHHGHPAMFIPHPVAKAHEFSSAHSHFPSTAEDQKPAEKIEGKLITSPMVGTFYSAPSPEDPPFVKVGDRVNENTVVCIIEAMKVMNEVKANISGVVKEVYLESGQPLEFGTKLFRIE
ncbi:MAG: acetyl-CoA carboxylase biotin carboxyl carrier protein [Rhabdochlamydiaceae bacterium]|nr:acetyl-CoA carboxylase biotin carboxyl carrier protein [Rhabdochlamydiaceae bacterium]